MSSCLGLSAWISISLMADTSQAVDNCRHRHCPWAVGLHLGDQPRGGGLNKKTIVQE